MSDEARLTKEKTCNECGLPMHADEAQWFDRLDNKWKHYSWQLCIDRLRDELRIRTIGRDSLAEIVEAYKERDDNRPVVEPKAPHDREPPHCPTCNCGVSSETGE